MQTTKKHKKPEVGDLCIVKSRCNLVTPVLFPGAYVEAGTMAVIVELHSSLNASYIMYDGIIGWLFNSELQVIK